MPQKLGQHFLIRGSILERIAAAACPTRQDLVVEIGPGRGALTEKLLQRAARVVAVEVDPGLVEHLRVRFGAASGLEIVDWLTDPEQLFAITLSRPSPRL